MSEGQSLRAQMRGIPIKRRNKLAYRDPSRPLPGREEAYAQNRAMGYRPCESCLIAGFTDRTGAATKYEKKPRVQRRIDFLRQNDLTAEYREAKRRHLEQRLELIAFGSMFEYMTVDANGQPHMDWRKFSESDLGVTLAEVRFDKDTGKVIAMARDNALNAISQLREMRGFKAAERVNLNLSSIDQLTDEELARIAASAAPALLPSPRDIEDEVVLEDEEDDATAP